MRLRQPKVVGEIVAGIVLGPALLGRVPAIARLTESVQHRGEVLSFVYWLGLLLLMFLSGAETRQLFTREERREVGWLTIVGTGIPFVLGLVLGPWLVRPVACRPAWQSHFADHRSRRRRRRDLGPGGLEDFCRPEDPAHPVRAPGAWE